MRKRLSMARGALALTFIGCAAVDRQPPAEAATARKQEEPAAKHAPQPDRTGGRAPAEFTLKEALALALLRSPELLTFSHEVRASEARELQAGALPNPELLVDLEDVAGTGEFSGFQHAQTTVFLSQLIELGGNRAARVDAASHARERAGLDYEVKRIDVLADVAQKFIHVAVDQEELDVAREARQLSENTLASILERVSAGKASPLEEGKARVALARSRVEEEHAEHELQAARQRLAATWGDAMPSFERVAADIFARRPLPAYEDLAARLDGSPRLSVWAAELRLRDAEARLAAARRIPALRAGAGVRRLEGPDEEALVFELAMPLPVFDRNQGGIAEAEARQLKTKAERRAEETRLLSLLFGLYQELKHADTELEILQSEVLPHARATASLASAGYLAGRYSYLDLADAQRTLMDARESSLRAALSYHELLLETERLLGEPLQ